MAVVGMNGRTKESGGGECGRAKQAMENVNEELGKAVIRVVECEDAGEGRDLRVASVVTYHPVINGAWPPSEWFSSREQR